MNYILLFFCTLVIFLCSAFYFYRDSLDFITVNNYPQIQILNDYKKTFTDEMTDYSDNSNWTIFKNEHIINNYNNLIKMNFDNIKKYLVEYSGKLNISSMNFLIYWLKINKKSIPGNIIYCPKTFGLLSSINNIINIGICAIKPGFSDYIIPLNFTNIIRCYIPFFIPQGDSGIQINNKQYNWSELDENNNVAIFEYTSHFLWNNTNTTLYVLLVDIINS